MNAEKAFRLWRRVLRDPALEQAIFGGSADELVAFDLDAEETAAAAALAGHRAAAQWPIRGYRYRVGDLTDETLRDYAPMTTAALEHHGRLAPAIRRFLDAAPWRENNCRLLQLICDFLDGLSRSPDVALVGGLADAIRLELAASRLLVRLAPLPVEAWLRPAFVVSDGERYVLGPAAELVTVDHDLGPWIENPDRAGQQPLEPAAEQLILVHLRGLDALPEYALLTRTAAAVCAELGRRPLGLADAAAMLGNDGAARARALLARFAALGILRPEADEARPAPDEQPFQFREWDEVLARQAENAGHPVRQALEGTLVEGCGELDGARVLDLATGDGRAAVALARCGAQVTAIDLARASLAAARAWADTLGPELAGRIDFQEMDVGSLAFPGGSFDRITCVRAFWLFPDIPRVLGEVYRVLRPGGRFVVQLWENAVRDTLAEIDPPWLLGHSIVARFVPGLATVDYVGSSSVTAELLQTMHEGAGVPGRLLTYRRFTRHFDIETPADYWALLSVVAATVHVFYAGEPPEVRAAMDEEWRMESAKLRRQSGAYPVDVTWGVATFARDE